LIFTLFNKTEFSYGLLKLDIEIMKCGNFSSFSRYCLYGRTKPGRRQLKHEHKKSRHLALESLFYRRKDVFKRKGSLLQIQWMAFS